MARLTWGGQPPSYDLGVDQGVLYLDGTAVPWNGLVSVDERESGFLNVDHYFDGTRVHISQATGDFEAEISAYTYPDVFAEYNGYAEHRPYRRFGFAYRTQHGFDGHKLHLVYNVLVRDDSRSWMTASDTVQPSTFSWSIFGESVPVPGASPSSRLTLEAPRDPSVLAAVENILYGTDSTDPRLPEPEELIELYEAATLLRITYHGDGTYTAEGPDDMVRALGDGQFEISAPTAFFLSQDAFVVHSY